MKRFPIIIILLMIFLTSMVVSAPSHAVTNKVILQIEGMT